jgi:pimeloyl-ACP methyl ester carboxylesterase
MALERKYITINGCKWAYLHRGEEHKDKPPVFILHGVLSYADYFAKIADQLSTDFEVYVPDLPGFGFSQTPSKNDLFHVTKEFVSFVKALGYSKAYFYGNSMGGSLLLALGILSPEIIIKTYIHSPYWRKDGINYRLLERFEIGLTYLPQAVIKRLANKTNLKILLKLAEYLRPDMKSLLNYNKDMILECLHNSDLIAMKEIFYSVDKHDFENTLHASFPETILIWGENDRTIPYRETNALKQLICKPICVVVGEDHELVMDSPQKIVEVIKCDINQKKRISSADFYWI